MFFLTFILFPIYQGRKGHPSSETHADKKRLRKHYAKSLGMQMRHSRKFTWAIWLGYFQ